VFRGTAAAGLFRHRGVLVRPVRRRPRGPAGAISDEASRQRILSQRRVLA
jgi:hypothetical protein